MPSCIFLPFGIWLTLKAANDSPLFDATRYGDLFRKALLIFKQKNAHTAA